MIIKSIHVKNFKGFKELTILLNEKTNVIIGENNIGKSSLFEAMLLWKKCFDYIIRPNKSDFYKIDSSDRYIPFNELRFIRLVNDTDLFNSAPNILRISFCILYNDLEYNLMFEIGKPETIKNSYLRFKTINHREFSRFANALKIDRIKLSDAIFIYQAKPVANILDKEPFMNRGQILKKISLGKSGDVLRNKIIRKEEVNITKIAEQVTSVLGYEVRYKFENRSKKDNDEYIILNVTTKGKKLDMHLQGSGLLQVTEIFSTIDFFSDKSINMLLIDEPDAHIHVKSQKRLLEEIKKIENTQSFIISHNDNFVSEVNNGELFYLDQRVKDSKILKSLALDEYDFVKNELGGIIIALDKLNSTNTICLTEGGDDITYIENLLRKYIEVTGKKIKSKPAFFHLRGKGELLKKIEYCKRLLPQIVNDKKYTLVYDKDYCTIDASNSYEEQLKRKLGQDSIIFRHDGYCIESILFSDKNNLVELLKALCPIDTVLISDYIDLYLNNLKSKLLDIASPEYKAMETKFLSQKQDGIQRPELSQIQYSDFLRCAYTTDSHQYIFNKNEIKAFIMCFQSNFEVEIIASTDTSAEYYSSTLFNLYIENIQTENDFFTSSLDMINALYKFE